MASDRATLAYRPDPEERKMLEALTKRYGLSMSRMIGVAVRKMAENENVIIAPTEHREAVSA